MNLFERVSRLLTANLNHLVDRAEDPEVMIKQLLREMEEATVELRRETVGAIARVKQLERQIAGADEAAAECERKASLALDHGDEELARAMLARKLQHAEAREALAGELETAQRLEAQLRDDMLRMEDKVQVARRRKDELVRRQRAAEARLRSQHAAQRSAAAVRAASGRVDALAFEGYADAITALEAEAEAARELTSPEDDPERRIARLDERSRVDRELERLRRERTVAG